MTSRTHTPEDVKKIVKPWVSLTMKDIREIAPLWFEQEKHECSLKEFVELIEIMVRLKNQ